MDKMNSKILTLLPFLLVMLLVIPGLAVAQEIPGEDEFADEVGPVGHTNEILPRPWADTPELIQEYKFIQSYVKNDLDDDYWNSEVKLANTIAYNLETQIGKKVEGYELATLYAKLQMLNGTYSPTEPERRLHKLISLMHDLPENKSQIESQIRYMTNNASEDLVAQSVQAVHRLVNLGSISPEVADTDPDYWYRISLRVSCGADPACEISWFGLEEKQGFEIRPVAVTYRFHGGHIIVNYYMCHGMSMCTKSVHHTGSNIETSNFRSPEHVSSNVVTLFMSAGGSRGTAVVEGGIYEPIPGISVSKSGTDFVATSATVNNPNARSESYIEIRFTSFIYS